MAPVVSNAFGEIFFLGGGLGLGGAELGGGVLFRLEEYLCFFYYVFIYLCICLCEINIYIYIEINININIYLSMRNKYKRVCLHVFVCVSKN